MYISKSDALFALLLSSLKPLCNCRRCTKSRHSRRDFRKQSLTVKHTQPIRAQRQVVLTTNNPKTASPRRMASFKLAHLKRQRNKTPRLALVRPYCTYVQSLRWCYLKEPLHHEGNPHCVGDHLRSWLPVALGCHPAVQLEMILKFQ